MHREDWVSVLKLSTMWDFLDIRKLAIQELSKMEISTVDKIILARDCKVAEWLLSGYNELAKRSETISLDEAARLGWEATVRIFQVREEVKFPLDFKGHVSCAAQREQQDFMVAIRRTFAAELREMGGEDLCMPEQKIAETPKLEPVCVHALSVVRAW